MTYYLKDKCQICGNRVEVITFREPGERIERVDYGICEGCGDKTIMPPEPIEKIASLVEVE